MFEEPPLNVKALGLFSWCRTFSEGSFKVSKCPSLTWNPLEAHKSHGLLFLVQNNHVLGSLKDLWVRFVSVKFHITWHSLPIEGFGRKPCTQAKNHLGTLIFKSAEAVQGQEVAKLRRSHGTGRVNSHNPLLFHTHPSRLSWETFFGQVSPTWWCAWSSLWTFFKQVQVLPSTSPTKSHHAGSSDLVELHSHVSATSPWVFISICSQRSSNLAKKPSLVRSEVCASVRGLKISKICNFYLFL